MKLEEDIIIKKTEEYVKREISNDKSGHDFYHALNVKDISTLLQKVEGGELLVIQLASLLHDVADWKLNNGSDEEGLKKVSDWLKNLEKEHSLPTEVTFHVIEIIRNMSFRGGFNKEKMRTIEGKIVQDADRLAALGAIGIARVFAYGGNKGKDIYNPLIKPKENYSSFEEYKNNNSSSINHFYEKLLRLKDMMNTKTAKAIAEKRTSFMYSFLDKFFEEWYCKDILREINSFYNKESLNSSNSQNENLSK